MSTTIVSTVRSASYSKLPEKSKMGALLDYMEGRLGAASEKSDGNDVASIETTKITVKSSGKKEGDKPNVKGRCNKNE